MPREQDYPPLMRMGVHKVSVNEIETMCVSDFPDSTTRSEIFGRLRTLLDLLTTTGIQAELWIDGSFVTIKENPGDVDLVLWFEPKMTISPSKQSLIREFHEEEELRRNKGLPYCDMYYSAVVRDWRQYWTRQFGTDRKGEPKGILCAHINGGLQ